MKEILTFLNGLKKNNNRDWFEAHRESYQAARDLFIEMIRQLVAGIAKFEPEVAGLRPKDCLFRINRDIRFSNDKRPYKGNFGAVINKGGKKSEFAVYYFHLQPGNESIVAGGIYMPQPETLKRIRQEIDYNPDPLIDLMHTREFEKYFGDFTDNRLKRPPKGYDEENPQIGLIKLKDYIVVRSFTDKEVTSPGFLKEVLKSFKAMKPLNDYLNMAIE